MNEYTLFSAIGAADDAFLQELEVPRRRIPRNFGLVAAILALMLTACAAPVIIRSFDNKVQSLQRSDTGEGSHVYVQVNGSKCWIYDGFYSHDAQVQVAAEPDAPETLEIQYFPSALLDYCTPEEVSVTDNSIIMELSTKVPRYGKIYGVLYQQHTIPEDGYVTVPNVLDDMLYQETENRKYGDIDAMIYEGRSSYSRVRKGEPVTPDSASGVVNTQIIFWSDGYYLYSLKLPITYNLPVTEVEKIVASLTQVEDITSYLSAAE